MGVLGSRNSKIFLFIGSSKIYFVGENDGGDLDKAIGALFSDCSFIPMLHGGTIISFRAFFPVRLAISNFGIVGSSTRKVLDRVAGFS